LKRTVACPISLPDDARELSTTQDIQSDWQFPTHPGCLRIEESHHARFGGCPSGSPPDINAIVTAIIVHKIRPSTEALYDASLNDIREASRRFPGYLSTDVIRPIRGLRQYTVILRFENFKTLSDWMGSDVRHSIVPVLQSPLVNRAVAAGCCAFLMVYVLLPPFARVLSKWLSR